MVMPINWNLSKLIVVDQATMLSETPESGEIFITTVNGIIQTKDDADVVREYVTLDTTQTLSGKTMDGDVNTFTDIGISSLKTVGANTNRFLTRDGSGVVTDAANPSLTNLTHNHTNAANGSQLTDAALSAAVGLAKGGTGVSLAATGPGDLQQASNGATITVRRHILSATAAPTVNDDSGDGYSIGSLWVDTTNDNIYMATDVSLGAANWEQINGGGGGGATDFTDLGDVPASYSGHANKVVSVKADESGLEFTTPSGSSSSTGGDLYLFAMAV